MKKTSVIFVVWTVQQLVCAITGIGGMQYAAAAPEPVWRFWSPGHQRHFYTISASEKDKLVNSYADVWTYEGVGYRAFTTAADAELRPVYRFWSDGLRAHFYTASESEKDKLVGQYGDVWTYEGVAFHAYPVGSQAAATLPVYRFWSGGLRTHFYTASETEKYKLISSHSDVWDYEGIAWYAYPATAPTAVSLVKGPYLQWPTSDSIVVTWETDVVADSRVDYGVATLDEAFAADLGLSTLHRMNLSGLAPDTAYAYRVTSGGATSAIGSFKTAPAAGTSFRFAVYGDNRTYPNRHAEVVQSMIHSGPELLFNVGDLTSVGRDYATWGPEFFDPAGDLLRTTPIVAVAGNHEYAGIGPLWFGYFFDLPSDGGWFAMTYGNTRFIGLNTAIDYAAGSAQHAWFQAELASAEYAAAVWHVVFFHHPAYTATSGHSDNATVQSQVVPLLEQYGVDLVFQGHSHAYERYLQNGIVYIVTGGGGAPLYALALDFLLPVRQFGVSAYHHCVVDVNAGAQTLTVTAVDTDDQSLDTVTLTRTP